MSDDPISLNDVDERVDWLPAGADSDGPSAETRHQIVSRRQDLYDAMQALESSVARASGQTDWFIAVDLALCNLEAALDRHVSEIEAPDGLFDEVIDRAPHLASDVQRLRQDHDELLASCRSASYLLSQLSPEELRRKVLGMLGRLAIHGQRGSELLFDTYNVDLAAAN